MIKAIFIGYDIGIKMNELNNELKNCKNIIDKITNNDGSTILIVDTVTRKEKLEKLNEL